MRHPLVQSMFRIRFFRLAARVGLLVAVVAWSTLGVSSEPVASSPQAAADASTFYSPDEQVQLGQCARTSDDVLRIALGKRNGKSAAEFKSRPVGQPGMAGAPMPSTVDRIYAQDIPNDWAYTVSFFKECTQSSTPVPASRVGLASYCMQNRMIAALAVAARDGGVSKDAVQEKFSSLKSPAAKAIVDDVFATPKTIFEAETAAWELCIGSRSPAASQVPARDLEGVRGTLSAHAAQIHQLYTQASKTDPALQGKVVVRFTIAPDGRVTAAETLSSELHRPDFEERVLALLRTMDFGAGDVAPLVATYPLDFAPG